MKYFGGKGGPGVFHTILRNIPPHRVYVEAFAGGANVFERKARAAHSVLIERDPEQAAVLRSTIVGNDVGIHNCDCRVALECAQWAGDEFVYLDPPYLHDTRSSQTRYRFEFDKADHLRLLELLARLPVPFALSGYRSAMYDDAAGAFGWRRIDFPAMTRGGARIESLWCNYAAPACIADPDYAGQDFRDRQRIKRKAARWVERFSALPALERQAILAQLAAAGIVAADDWAPPSRPTMLPGTVSLDDAAASSVPTFQDFATSQLTLIGDL